MKKGFYMAILNSTKVLFFINEKGEIHVVRFFLSISSKGTIYTLGLCTKSYKVYEAIYIPISENIEEFKSLNQDNIVYLGVDTIYSRNFENEGKFGSQLLHINCEETPTIIKYQNIEF